jgi:hypothetical protein
MTIYETLVRRRTVFGILTGIAALLLSLAFVAGLSFGGGPVAGRVLDIDTQLPIPDAMVVARWQRSTIAMGHSSSYCVHVQTALSGQDGHYRIARWWRFPPILFSDGLTGMDAYRPGYETVASHTPDAVRHPEDVYMKKFTGTDVERFEYLHWQVFSGMSCTEADASRRNLFALHKAALREARGLVQSESDRKNLEGMLIVAASNWLAATPNYHETFLRPLENLPANVRRELE